MGRRFRPATRRDGAVWLGCTGALVLLAIEQISLAGYIGGDFRIFHRAVGRFLTEPLALYGPVGRPLESAHTLSGFIYPPPAILALVPFGLGTLEQDFAVFTTVSLLLGASALALWVLLANRNAPRRPLAEQALLLLLALASGPVFACRAGQIDLAILALCTLAAWCALTSRPCLGGALLAAGAWIKIYPVLLVVPLVLAVPRGQRTVLGFALAALAIPAMTALAVPATLWHQYFGELLPHMPERAIVNIYNQSLAAVYLRGQVPHTIAVDSFAALPVPAAIRIAVLILGAVIVGLATRTAQRRPQNVMTACAVVLATISLIAPLGWGHAYVYVMPLWLVLASRALRERDRWAGATVATAWLLLLTSAHHRFGFAEQSQVLWTLVYSRYALATLTLVGLALMQAILRPDASCPD